MKQILRPVKQALDESGLPWRASHGKKHLKVYLGGTLSLSLSRGAKAYSDWRKVKHVLCAIKRRTREGKGAEQIH